MENKIMALNQSCEWVKKTFPRYQIYSYKHLNAKQISLIVRCVLFRSFYFGKRMKQFGGALLVHNKYLRFIYLLDMLIEVNFL